MERRRDSDDGGGMRSFESLTSRGQAGRLRRLATRALEQYELDIADVRLAGMHTNVLFRVRTVDGTSYMLRVCTPGWRTGTDLLSEITWLRALSRDTDIGAPEPQPTRNAEFVATAGATGIPEPRRCLLMSWIPAAQLGKRLTAANLYKMGTLFARLHEHAAGFSPPPDFTRRRMDSIYARGETELFFDDSCREAFTPRDREILERTRAVVTQAFAELYADPYGLRVIHNDLWHGNIKLHRGCLRPLDFEDTVWGYPVQDIAMALQDLMMDVGADEFEPLQSAFRAGYESAAGWPESQAGQIDTFRTGRMLWVGNYVAQYQRQYLGEHVERLARRCEGFLESGIMRKP